MVMFLTDAESALSQLKNQEKQLKLKRRWLMGLPTSRSKRKQSKGLKLLKEDRSLPESILREDDIFYETVKTCVQESFGAFSSEDNLVQENVQFFGSCKPTRVLMSCLDALTNKGLYHIAMVLTGGSVKFEKTRRLMKKVIRDSLLKDFRNQNHLWRKNILKQLSLILNDPKNFRENGVTLLIHPLQSHCAAATKVLDVLGDLPFEALTAMQRKLRGVQRGLPQLRYHRHGRSRGHIISQVRKTSKKMLSELSKEEELQEPLAKAMAVAGLSLKLKPGCQNSFGTDFHKFSPEIKSLQNEIVKAIWLLKTKVRFSELKTLQRMIDPNSDISNGHLRTAIKKMLLEYLFECSDLDTIPKSLLETLAIINRNSRSTPYRCFPKEEIEEEVECILSVSAQTKQIAWDLLPDHVFDQDFTDAYMEELEESDDSDDSYYDDDDDDDDDGNGNHGDNKVSRQQVLGNYLSSICPSVESDHRVEGTGESMPVDFKPPASAAGRNGSSANITPNDRANSDSVESLDSEHFMRVDSDPNRIISSSKSLELSVHNGRVNMDINQYGVESTGKFCSSITEGSRFSSFITPKDRLNGNLFKRHEAELNAGRDSGKSGDLFSSDLLFEDTKCIPSKQSRCRNQYLAIQEACDETSMVAYNLIGHMLDKFAQEEDIQFDQSESSYLKGNSSTQEYTRGERHTSSEDVSVIVQTVEELIPSIPKSGIEKLKKLIDI